MIDSYQRKISTNKLLALVFSSFLIKNVQTKRWADKHYCPFCRKTKWYYHLLICPIKRILRCLRGMHNIQREPAMLISIFPSQMDCNLINVSHQQTSVYPDFTSKLSSLRSRSVHLANRLRHCPAKREQQYPFNTVYLWNSYNKLKTTVQHSIHQPQLWFLQEHQCTEKIEPWTKYSNGGPINHPHLHH